jgi:enediyne biosynthesis protein E4
MLYSRIVLSFLVAGSLLLQACKSESSTGLFKRISSAHSGIHFNNVVVENDSINPLDLEFLYNGGGVAAGDFDNDGFIDLYFTASTTSNKLYLNRYGFVFDDITEKAGVAGEGRWCNAASAVDINNDGLLDIYVCTTINPDPEKRKNLLYINEGLKNNIPVFREMAAEYGLADTSYSVHAGFFDYDNDGDLDMYLATTKLAGRTSTQFFSSNSDSLASRIDFDKLFRNDWNDSLKHPVYTDVSKQAGIANHGFALGLAIADINRDGWKDIYVTNDFYSNDELYINNRNGSFTNKLDQYLKHTTQNAMGNDIADINNDGLADIIAVDMNPEDNYRKKKNMGATSYYVYQNMIHGNYALQYIRNTLQLNQGPSIHNNDSIGEPVFSDIGFFAGVAETDWSWAPLVADFDNDGLRDIIITNGYPRDVTDRDFGVFRASASRLVTKQELIEQIPQIKVSNYAFRNMGQLKFENVTKEWGINQPAYSYGAAYADLDNDGDLDYVVNNINDEAFVYENRLHSAGKTVTNFLQVEFAGDTQNKNGLGAIVELYTDSSIQAYENFPWRGYLSSVTRRVHFGLGNHAVIDSLRISWPGGKTQLLKNVAAHQVLLADIKNAVSVPAVATPVQASGNLFSDVTRSLGIDFRHLESDFVDFDAQRLLLHKFSQYGPGLAAGDIDGNGFDDIVTGGNTLREPTLLLQQGNGKFLQKELPPPKGSDVRKSETMGILLFDADGDNDLDIYCASGSNEFTANTKSYQDRIYINNGKGDFICDLGWLPAIYTSKSCVKAADYDLDGDYDLFVGGRVMPGKYPQPVSSYILRNDCSPGKVRFTDVTKEVAPALINIGLVCDAIWTNFDNASGPDLIIAGEWMPLKLLRNNGGKFEDITASSGLAQFTGWWNSIAAADFDNDGDIDYVAGNLGENSYYRASDQYPVRLYAKDFDKNEGFDAIPTQYLKDVDGSKKEFPAQSRDEIVEQLPVVKKKYLTYKTFGRAGFKDIFTEEELKDAMVLTANHFKSSYIRNDGNGKFSLHPLPPQAQLAPVYGMVADDFNNDGNIDIALAGNDHGNEVTNGRYDAMNGLLLQGDGNGNFKPQSILQSGLYIPGDARALIKLKQGNKGYLLAASQNLGKLKVFQLKTNNRVIPVLPGEVSATYFLKNGRRRAEEFYNGNSFLSQSSKFVLLNEAVDSIRISNAKGISRTVKL